MSGGDRPKTAEQLHAFLQERLELVIPTRPIVRGHTAPFDYLAHAYFDGAVPTGGVLPQIEQRSPDCVVWANRGGGKTFLAAVATMLDLVFKPGIEVRVLAGSLDQAKRMHAHLRGLFENPWLAEQIAGRATETRLRLASGSNVELLAQSQTSVRGTRVQKLRCDEVELFDSDVWEAAQLVTRSKQCGDVFVPGTIECLSTMHVPHGLMWRLVQQSGTRPGADRTLFKWGVVDVLDRCDDAHDCATCSIHSDCEARAKQRDAAGDPAGHVAVSDAVTMRSRVSKPTWEAEMLCLRPSRRDAVLPEFDAATHAVPALESEGRTAIVAGMDFGIRAPTVVLWARIEADGSLHVIAERSVAGVVMDRHAEAILKGEPQRAALCWKNGSPPAWIGVDPAGGQRNDQTGLSNVQLMRDAGLTIKDRRLPVAAGLELVRRRLAPADGPPMLRIDPACTTLIESIERYRYPSDKPESSEPLKDGHDHAVDALRYLVQNLDAGYATKVGRY